MATLEEIDTLAQDPAFTVRVSGGIARIASEIGSRVLQGIDVDQDNNPVSAAHSALRLRLARQVLADMTTWTATFSRVLAADSSVDITSTDDLLQFYIRSYWNLLAGVGI